jgi:hypothetical protein
VSVTSTKKEGGRQLQMLEAYHVAGALTGDPSFQGMEAALLGVALNQDYYLARMLAR